MGLAFHALDSGTRTSGSRRPTATSTSLPARPTAACSRGSRTTTASRDVRVRDVETGKDLPEPDASRRAPRRASGPASSRVSRDGSRLALAWDQPAPAARDLRRRDRDRRRAPGHREPCPPGCARTTCATPSSIRYPSFDGREIPAWLYRPDGDGPAPFVVAIHGGPEAQEKPVYRPVFQYLLSRGIGVLATNIRGSTGYGKTYQTLIHHDWGGADMEDWRHAAEWLKAQEFVDGDRLGVYGGSYGGFATLTCVTRLPEYWRAAVDIVGPSNLLTFVRAVPPQWMRFMARVGRRSRHRGRLPARALADHVRRPGDARRCS